MLDSYVHIIPSLLAAAEALTGENIEILTYQPGDHALHMSCRIRDTVLTFDNTSGELRITEDVLEPLNEVLIKLGSVKNSRRLNLSHRMTSSYSPT